MAVNKLCRASIERVSNRESERKERGISSCANFEWKNKTKKEEQKLKCTAKNAVDTLWQRATSCSGSTLSNAVVYRGERGEEGGFMFVNARAASFHRISAGRPA